MCGCRNSNDTALLEDIYNKVNCIDGSCNLNKNTNMTQISAVDWMNKDLLSFMKLGYCANREGFEKVFKDIGIKISSEEDLKILDTLYKSGGDVRGDLKTPDGKTIKFSVLKVLGNIYISTKGLEKCSVRFTDLDKIV